MLEQGGCSAAGAELLRPAPPRTWPRSCLPARCRPGVLIRSKRCVAGIKPRAAVETLLLLGTPTPTNLLRSPSSPRLLPFQTTRAHQQLRQDLSHRLRPRAQALPCRSSNPSHSSPIPAETPPWTPHRGQPLSELLNCRSLLH